MSEELPTTRNREVNEVPEIQEPLDSGTNSQNDVSDNMEHLNPGTPDSAIIEHKDPLDTQEEKSYNQGPLESDYDRNIVCCPSNDGNSYITSTEEEDSSGEKREARRRKTDASEEEDTEEESEEEGEFGLESKAGNKGSGGEKDNEGSMDRMVQEREQKAEYVEDELEDKMVETERCARKEDKGDAGESGEENVSGTEEKDDKCQLLESSNTNEKLEEEKVEVEEKKNEVKVEEEEVEGKVEVEVEEEVESDEEEDGDGEEEAIVKVEEEVEGDEEEAIVKVEVEEDEEVEGDEEEAIVKVEVEEDEEVEGGEEEAIVKVEVEEDEEVEGGEEEAIVKVEVEEDEEVEGGEEEGDGEEKVKVKKAEPEEPVKSGPMHVPTTGKFFQHDDRKGDQKESDVQERVPPPSRADLADRWLHDSYREDEQGPRKDWEKEKVATYQVFISRCVRDLLEFNSRDARVHAPSRNRGYEGENRTRKSVNLGSYIDGMESGKHGRREGPYGDKRRDKWEGQDREKGPPGRSYPENNGRQQDYRERRERGGGRERRERGEGNSRRDDERRDVGQEERRERGGGNRNQRDDERRDMGQRERWDPREGGEGNRNRKEDERRDIGQEEKWERRERGGGNRRRREDERPERELEERGDRRRRNEDGGKRQERREWGRKEGRDGGREMRSREEEVRRGEEDERTGGWRTRGREWNKRDTMEDENMFPLLSSAVSECWDVDSSSKPTTTSWSTVVSSGNIKSDDSGLISGVNKTDPIPKDGEREPSPLASLPGRGASPSYSAGEPKDGHTPISSSRTKFGIGRGIKTTVFTLTKDKELVKSHGRKMGKARGRGHAGIFSKAVVAVGRSNQEDSKDEQEQMRYDRPISDSVGIMDAISLSEDAEGRTKEDKGEKSPEFAVERDQFADGSSADLVSLTEMEDQPGLPLRGSGISRREEDGDAVLTDVLPNIVEATTKVEATEQPAVISPPQADSAGVQRESVTVAQGGLPCQQTGGVPQQPMMTKPKRYSSQRQKLGGGTRSGQAMGAAGDKATPPLPIPHPDQAYNEAIAQQMKMFHLQKESMAAAAAAMGGGLAGGPVPPGVSLQNMMGLMYQNPQALQQLMWLNMQQQQRGQQMQPQAMHAVPMASDQVPFNSHPNGGPLSHLPGPHHIHPHPPNIGLGDLSILGVPPNMPYHMQGVLPHVGGLEQMSIDSPLTHYVSPGGIYFPMNLPMPPEFVQQSPQQMEVMPLHIPPIQSNEGRPRSQAVPIVPPSVTVGEEETGRQEISDGEACQ